MLRQSMHVSEEELKSMLRRAYESGWQGFMEGMEDCVSEIVSGFRPRPPVDPNACFTTTTFTPSSNSNVTDPYYYYSSMTLALPQSGEGGEIV
jgi:hypothetical protein